MPGLELSKYRLCIVVLFAATWSRPPIDRFVCVTGRDIGAEAAGFFLRITATFSSAVPPPRFFAVLILRVVAFFPAFFFAFFRATTFFLRTVFFFVTFFR